MGEEICKSGKWIDNETGRVVDSEPRGSEGGRLLVAPGGVITPAVAQDIAEAQRVAPVESAVQDAPEQTADESTDVETATDVQPVSTAASTKGRAR